MDVFLSPILLVISSLSGLVIIVLGFWVYFSNKDSLINNLFLGVTFSTFLWILTVIFRFYFSSDPYFVTFIARVSFAVPTFLILFLYYFTFYFPIVNKKHNKLKSIALISAAIIIAVVSIFTPLVVGNIEFINARQYDTYGFFYYLFALYFLFLLIASVLNLLFKKKYLDAIQKKKVNYVLVGFLFSAVGAFTTNVLIPSITNKTEIAIIGPSFLIFFIIFTTYAIFKYKLFDLKIITTEIFVFALWTVLVIRTAMSDNLQDFFISSALLLSTVFIGVFLIQSVIREVRQKEEIEKLARKLEKTNTELKELDKMKTEFLSLATHQIRSPLTSMRGYVSMMLEGDYGEVNESLKEPLRVVDRSSEGLIKVVNDFLDVSRMEQGRMQYNIEKHDFYQIVNNMVEEYRPSVEERGLKIGFEAEKKDYNVKVDENKMEQVIGNLIDNSVKYTPEGEINIKLSKPNEKTVRFEIIDTGVGIAPEEIPKLFTKFQRAKGAEKVSITGSGLGIYLAKRITEDHGGIIKVSSEGEGMGSVFTVDIPSSD